MADNPRVRVAFTPDELCDLADWIATAIDAMIEAAAMLQWRNAAANLAPFTNAIERAKRLHDRIDALSTRNTASDSPKDTTL